MQPENGGAGFNTKTHHQVDGSNGNSEMREEVGRGGGLFVANTTRCHRLSSLTCTCKSRIFAQQEFDSCWMFLVDRRAYTCHIRVSHSQCIGPSARLVEPDVQIILPIHPLPSLASANWRIFAPCEESDSRMVFISKVVGSFPGRSGDVFLSILYVLNNALKAKKSVWKSVYLFPRYVNF